MFKKNISVVSTRPLSGKDIKKLKKDVQTQFPALSEDDLKKLIPSKGEISVLKLSNKAQAYSTTGGNPLFFDPAGRGDALVPTVYTLWACPHILPPLYTYSEVTPKVLGGADLFLQGLIVPPSGLGTFAAGDLRVATINSNCYPFAVGTMETSSEAIAKAGLKGKGLKLLHHYPDQLWALGDKSVPDASYTPARIFPQNEAQAAAAAKKLLPDPSVTKAMESLTFSDSSPDPTASAPAGLAETAATDEGANGTPSDAPESAAVGASGDSQTASASGQSQPQDAAELDALLGRYLVGGLHSVQDSELPMLSSTFYAKHMLACKPAGLMIDIKKSSYKKLSKLLTKFEKEGLLAQKLVHKQDNLASVNRKHPLYTSYDAAAAGKELAAANAQAEADGVAVPSSSGKGIPAGKIEVEYLYRVPSSLRPIFGSGAAKEELYSEQACWEALLDYAEANGLPAGQHALKLDKLLLSCLFNKKEPQMEGDVHPLDDTMQRLLGKLQIYHRVTRPSATEGTETVVQKGSIKSIVLQLEDRQGGRKHITRVSHVESFAIDPDELSGVLQRKFQTSASVTKLPGKNETGKEIALQGKLVHEISGLLTTTYGIDAKFLDIKTKGKVVA
ncbi:hypothetical protein WJX72_001321 [[Myrmecia] bisecta]|uniref:SUI1 domain-containing protein n=1 Tax=[Myrmecia] bisecta TaxID=41462 RepID=A0AAW1PWK2_9CHLO